MSAEFTKAAEDVKKLKSKPGQTQLLELYSLYKVGNAEDFSKVSKPGVFDMAGKAKYSAWEKEVKAGTTPEGAQQRYIAAVDKLKSDLGVSA